MMRAAIFLAAVVGAAPAGAGGHRGFALAEMTASVAQEKCPGVKANLALLAGLRATTVTDEDEPAFAIERKRMAGMIDVAILRFWLTRWCDASMALFGPDGSVAPGLLEQQ